MMVVVLLQVMMSSSSLLQRKLIVLLLLVLVMNIITIEVPIIYFAESLALLPTQSNTNRNTNTNQQQPTLLETSSSSRREVLSNLFSTGRFLATATVTAAATVLLEPDVAEAAIDVSTLRSQQQFKSAVLSTTTTLPLNSAAGSSSISNTDIFLGGTYVDDADDKSNNKKYYISLSGLGFAGYRLITVKGGSNLEDFVELPGMIFTCPVGGPTAADGSGGQRQCITIDLSSIGGIKDAQGYWDDDNNGIRFVLENNIWSKKQ
ncbi:hypothetical protein FRACYDRAFT_267946 [Fragilariopsis cylindrus CCMP1102]|uniref:Uncharacterized protein n=1 Tax=Fragilariopsis cylindrus CCMP1102 TaxID=635003 RepID=A0A1E7FUQ8_9STRA|nr:hypothetical protein FRACYDRAFT_267946 [Fragilariopsis cylindrus CCMP1102]|eukprot:OEU21573.1 hypothetical protein FRACYDRAFT_267946 [Fragilariopsis cylindrus CCMP1102]